jgi:hypothetical protein
VDQNKVAPEVMTESERKKKDEKEKEREEANAELGMDDD